MLLINLNIILYALQQLRGFLIIKPTNQSDNLALIANNTIAFSLTKKEFKAYNNFQKQKLYANIPFHFNNINYKNEITEHTYKVYPTVKFLPVNYINMLNTLFVFFSEQNISKILGIYLKRKKRKFYIRFLGLLGTVTKYQFLVQYALIWENYKNLTIFSYKKLIKLMLYRLHCSLFVEIKQLCLKLFFKAKNKKFFIKKTKKYYNKVLLKPKLKFIFKSQHLTLI